MFRKGAYIVCLRPIGTSTPYIRRGWVYKQKEEHPLLVAEIDSTSLRRTITPDTEYAEEDTWRYATSEEMGIYDAIGPYPVLEKGYKVAITAENRGLMHTIVKDICNSSKTFTTEEGLKISYDSVKEILSNDAAEVCYDIY
jgi:hypothetical protein